MCDYNDLESTRIHVMAARAADQGTETQCETTKPREVDE